MSTLDGMYVKVWFQRGAGIADQAERLTGFDGIPHVYCQGSGLHVAQQDTVALTEENHMIPKRVLGIRVHQHAVWQPVFGRENLAITRRDDPNSERIEIARVVRKHD
jgi:hypothetical protein